MEVYYLLLIAPTFIHRTEALSIDGQILNVEKGANVSTYDSILSGISMIRCVGACLQKGEEGKCNMAGYHRGTRTCLLSLDTRIDIINVPDRDYVVIDIRTETTLSQWAQIVVAFSSQYSTEWSADLILGSTDNITWSAATSTGQSEFIEIQFTANVHVTSIDIYETYGGGSVQAIRCYQSEGEYVNLWSTNTTELIQEFRIFSPPLTGNCFSNQIRLEMTANGDWSDFDAVMLHGKA